MEEKEFTVIGVMSGTSLDGIDLACIRFKGRAQGWTYQFIATDTVAYDDFWHKKLSGAINLKPSEVSQLDHAYTVYLAKIIKAFMATHKLRGITAICSHGHTVFHEPDKGETLQIGNRKELADLTGETVICDFRSQDVSLGGQGAPLVPIGDRLLFSDYDACLNLGGFANISSECNDQRRAYDICPLNTVLNHYAQKCGVPFDAGGRLAERSHISGQTLNALDQLAFYRQPPPKSLGIEWVRTHIFPILDHSHLPPEDVLATFTEHAARQLRRSIEAGPHHSGRVLVTGGGAHNTFLINRIRELSNAAILLPKDALIDYKEALVFGLLGILRLIGAPNVLSSVTGAGHDHSSGIIYRPTKT